jgi:hypothetical protein
MLDDVFDSSGDHNIADYLSTFAASQANQLAPGQSQTIGLCNHLFIFFASIFILLSDIGSYCQ